MISAYYILYNEQDNIIRSLESIKNKVDEIIICIDNKTTDETERVIDDWYCQTDGVGKGQKTEMFIYHFDWSGFADARNFAISKCSGDWIVTIDADETLENGAGLKQLTSDLDTDIWECIQLDLDGQMCQTYRIFRNGIKYKDAEAQDIIHECLNVSGWKVGKSDLVFKHWKQLTPEQHKAKVEMIMNTFAEIPEGAKKDYYEGIYFLHTGQAVKGIELLNKCIDKVGNPLKAFLYMLIGTYYGKLASLYTELEAGFLNKSIEIAPDQNEGYVRLSEYYLNKGNIFKAIECLVVLQGRKNKLMSDLQNDKFYSEEQINNRINQLKEISNGISGK